MAILRDNALQRSGLHLAENARSVFYRITGQGGTLLDVMDSIPGGDGIEFEPPRLDVHVSTATFE
jgi:hypothetical protein